MFQVDAFLASSKLAPCRVWHVGESNRKNRPPSETAGFNVVISDADEIGAQVKDTMAFLDRHHGDLLRLSIMADVEELILDFGIARRDVPGQFDYLPPDLVRAAAGFRMGIEFSQYDFGE